MFYLLNTTRSPHMLIFAEFTLELEFVFTELSLKCFIVCLRLILTHTIIKKVLYEYNMHL